VPWVQTPARASIPTRWSRERAAVVLAFAAFLVLGWQGVTTVGREGGNDAGAHLAYAEYLDAHGHIPGKSVNYEYATPPLFHAAAIAAEHILRGAPSQGLELSSNWLTRALWLILVGGGAAALTAEGRKRRLLGGCSLALGCVWGLDEIVSLAKTEPWSGGQLIALATGAGLVLVTGLIARELWPDHPRRALAAGGFVAAYPVVYRMSILFHPEMPLAFLCAVALLVFLRAARRDWPRSDGWALGAVCGAAALTRQTALVVIVCLGVAGVAIGGRRAAPFLARAAVVLAMLAVPWWIYAAQRWHNPLQSNLEPRASLMMNSQPLSFFVSFPIKSLVLHPYRESFSNELLPKLHADLWSDWFGAIHPFENGSSKLDRVTASTQSVLGLAADALAVGGLFALAIPAGIAVLRRRSLTPRELGLGLLALVTIAGFCGFVVMLLRFPQRYGDPIKSSYLLFTAPAWAIFSVAAWAGLRNRVPAVACLLPIVAVLYGVSYAADLGAALDHRAGDRSIPGLAGIVDLSTTWQQTSPSPGIGGEVDFLVGVNNTGNQTGSDIELTVQLPPALHLQGPPFYELGSGCTGTSTLRCNLGSLAAASSTLIRFGVLVNEGGPQTLTATVSSSNPDANPSDNSSSITINLGPA